MIKFLCTWYELRMKFLSMRYKLKVEFEAYKAELKIYIYEKTHPKKEDGKL